MSIFASETTATMAIPFDVPHTVTIRKLSGREVEKAASEHADAFMAGRRPRGWPGFFQRVLADGLAKAQDAEKAMADPLAGYDRLVIAQAGVKAWSYEKPVTPTAIADLDDDALEFFAIEIMRLTKPGLFQTPAEQEAARKND